MAVGSRPFVPSRLAPGGVAHGSRRTPTTVLGAYVALTKPRIIELLLITTVPTMVLAEEGWPATWLVIVTLIGGTLAAGGANAVNMYVDRDIDALMARTRNRPLVTGVIPARNALIFALSLAGGGLRRAVGGRQPAVGRARASAAAAFYVGVYTLWLKRTSRQNIVIGGVAGAVPVLVGWAAVQDSLAWPPILLFIAMFLWTPPHFWALAVKYADDYRAADVPMLPAVAPIEQVVKQMIGYTVALVVTTLRARPGRRSRLDLRNLGRRARCHLHRRHARPRQAPDAGRQHAAVRLLDHVRDAAVRRHDPRRVRATRLLTVNGDRSVTNHMKPAMKSAR